MSLGAPSSGIRWKDYQIDTPTFQLSPVEKPDMSPFLFHMTGKKQILSILDPDSNSSPDNHGFLRAHVPEATSQESHYNAEVVCFSESPTFALDFFRYRSFKRWRDDQSYGIGFDKSALATLGARPCIYAENQLKNDIIVLKERLDTVEIDDPVIKERLPSLISAAYPLIMPLLENTCTQGFMWEREWRYVNNDNGGLQFPLDSIRVICCPENEEKEIKQKLGDYAKQIEFVRSWREYNEVTSYLKNRKKEMHVPQKNFYSDDKEYLDSLEEQLENHSKVFHKIDAFKSFIESIESKGDSTNEALSELQNTMDTMLSQIRNLKEKL